MIKRCKICKVPLEGLGYKLIAKPFFGVCPGNKKNVCNKCESK
ncbi:MAG: hypothetical protein WCK29_03365 [archaeon]